MEALSTLDEKISSAIEKVKRLKDEKDTLEQKLLEYEDTIKTRDSEIERLKSEKSNIKEQLEELLDQLEGLEL